MSELVERLRAEITGWERAFPLSAFPEPDLEKVAAVLEDAGMTLDAISASNMRHVVSLLAPMTHEAADRIEALEAECERWVKSLHIAQDQALSNGEAARSAHAKGYAEGLEAAAVKAGEWAKEATDESSPKDFRLGAEWASTHIPTAIRSLRPEGIGG